MRVEPEVTPRPATQRHPTVSASIAKQVVSDTSPFRRTARSRVVDTDVPCTIWPRRRGRSSASTVMTVAFDKPNQLVAVTSSWLLPSRSSRAGRARLVAWFRV